MLFPAWRAVRRSSKLFDQGQELLRLGLKRVQLQGAAAQELGFVDQVQGIPGDVMVEDDVGEWRCRACRRGGLCPRDTSPGAR